MMASVFSSEEEIKTIVHLHDRQMSEEVLSANISDLVDVVTYRGESNKQLQLSARQMNSYMRENYTGFIHNVGRNIYPMIIASDFEPGFEGVGSSFTLYLADGSQYKIAPTVSTNYEIYKALSHVSLAIFIILAPHLKAPKNMSWRGKLAGLRGHLEVFESALVESDKDESWKSNLQDLVDIYKAFIDTVLSNGTFSLDEFLEFASKAFAKIRINMAGATKNQARAILPAMLKWKKMLGPEEWSKVYVMIPTVWPVALNSPRLQLFERIIDADKIHTHIITSEFPRNLEECRDVVGRVVGDRSVGRLVFGTADTKAKMKVLALSSRTDVVADDFEIALNELVSELDPMDAALVNQPQLKEAGSEFGRIPSGTASGVDENGIPSACPMHSSKRAASTGPVAPAGITVLRASLLGREGLWDIATEGGLITAITPAALITQATQSVKTIDAAGRLALPGLIDAHVHLDKAYILDRCCAAKGDFAEALSETLAAKKAFTAADVATRARRLLESEIAHGTTLMRSHVEVDPIVGYAALDGVLPLREEYAWAVTLQICVFAQEGITNQPGQIDMMREALRRGCDVVGSAPYCDPNPEANIAAVFDLAAEFNVAVDFHLDYHLEGKPALLPVVVAETLRRGWQGRVTLGHMTQLSTLDETQLADVGKTIADAGISVLCLPASDICMMGRGDAKNKRRGVCPVHVLAAAGVCAAFATNNVQNLFTFSGDGDVLKIATLTCQLLQLTSEAGAQQIVSMATTDAAAALGVRNHSLVVGAAADMVIVGPSPPSPGETVPRSSALELLAAPPVDRIVLKAGRVVSRSNYTRTLFR